MAARKAEMSAGSMVARLVVPTAVETAASLVERSVGRMGHCSVLMTVELMAAKTVVTSVVETVEPTAAWSAAKRVDWWVGTLVTMTADLWGYETGSLWVAKLAVLRVATTDGR